MTSVITTTCGEYFERHKDEGPDDSRTSHINVTIPISLREGARSMDEIKINNDMTVMLVKIPIIKEFEKAVAHFKI